MSRSPNKQKNAPANAELALADEIKCVSADSEQFMRAVFDSVLFQIRRRMADLIVSAGKNARLCGCDEKIFNTYKNLIEYYRQSMQKYDECERIIANPRIKTIIGGVYSVLVSETNNKDETLNSSADNPISLEKKAIVSKSLSLFARSIEECTDSFTQNNYVSIRDRALKLAVSQTACDSGISTETVMEIASMMAGEIYRGCHESFGTFLSDSVKYCVSSLNDLESRTTTNFYYDLLDKSAEILTSIIKIQVIAIDTENYGSPGEKMSVNRFLSPLLEAYQVTMKNLSEIKSCFNETDDAGALNVKLAVPWELPADFLQIIEKLHKYKSGKDRLEKSIAGFKERIIRHVGHEIENELFAKNIHKRAYGYSLRIKQIMDMTDEMIQAFRGIIAFFDNDQLFFTEGESLEIINGIRETVSIKIECLEEHREVFKETASQALTGLKSHIFGIDMAELAGCADKAVAMLIDSCLPEEPCEKKHLSLINDVLHDAFGNIIQKYRESFEKSAAAYDGMLDKRDFTYKRDYLLYEVTTFEEILNYSVSRLAEDPDENVRAFVGAVYDSVELVDIVLKKNGIFQIKPEPHDMFNSKEHEVLLVEKNPDFTKGEVIKLMNSGYKQNDQVIIRANIIAAS